MAISLTVLVQGQKPWNLCAGFGLAIAGWKVNPKELRLRISSVHQNVDRNVLAKPKNLITNDVSSVLSCSLIEHPEPLKVQVLVQVISGPINALNLAEGGWSVMNIVIVTLISPSPIALNIVFVHLFEKVLNGFNQRLQINRLRKGG